MDNFSLQNSFPYIIDETENFAVVFKPPRMHCTSADSSKEKFRKPESNEDKNGDTLIEWFKKNSASVYDIMHRLDYETHGLVLFAKNEKSFSFFKSAQDNDDFIKEYSAECIITKNNSINSTHSKNIPDFFYLARNSINGFPPSPLFDHKTSIEKPFVIESYFRPFGQGRKVVRPVTEENKKQKETVKNKGGFYKTEIVGVNNNIFTVRIKRGFRHQIRCHLFWIGFPILNDPLYFNITSGETARSNIIKENKISCNTNKDVFLALKSHAIFFNDPETGIKREYRIPPLAEN